MDFYVWERQKRGALHLHYCCVVENPDVRAEIIESFHSEWRSLMLRLSRLSGVDVFERSYGGSWKNNPEYPRTDAQECEKSAVSYLAKYTSKECGKGYGRWCPNRWWGISRPLLALTRSLTTKIDFRDITRATSEKLYEFISHVVDTSAGIVHHWRQEGGLRRGIFAATHQQTDFEEIKCTLSLSSLKAALFQNTCSYQPVPLTKSIKDTIHTVRRHALQSSIKFSPTLIESLRNIQGLSLLDMTALPLSSWLELKSITKLCLLNRQNFQYERLLEYIEAAVTLPDVPGADNSNGACGGSPEEGSGEVGEVDSTQLQLRISAL